MNGAVLTDEGRAELAALRRRAFGPDADIFDDPAAVERLRELEASVLPASSPVGWGGAPAALARPVTPVPTATAVKPGKGPEPRAIDYSLDEEDALQQLPAAPRRFGGVWDAMTRFLSTRPRRFASVIAVGILMAALGGAMGWQIAQPRPDRILAADDTRYTPAGEGTDLWLKEMYGIRGAFRGHEPYGHVHVFTGTARNGSECMVVMIGTDDAVGTSCSPRPLPASADLFILPGWTEAYTGLDLPAGSIVRFVQSGDDVEVWTAIMPSSAPTL